MRSSRVEAILRSVLELGEPIRAHGASPSARAWLLARWRKDLAKPLIVLCPNSDAAEALAADIESLSAALLRAPARVLVFPTWEQSPYRPVAPSIKVRLERVAILAELRSGLAPGSILVTTLAAANQATLSPRLSESLCVQISPNQSVGSREELVSRLLDAGYLRVDPVEDPGTLAVRGDIVDVFPPGSERAYRIELFDDVIERIRPFDPATQRTLTAESAPLLLSLTIPPAREVVINRATSGPLRERLKQRADDLGIPRTARDPILASVSDGIYPDHSDAWAPFAYDAPSTLWDHIGPGSVVAWSDEMECLQEWDAFLDDQKNSAEDAARSGLVLPPVEELYRRDSPQEAWVRSRTRLYLDRLELAELGQAPEASEETLEAATAQDSVSPKHRIVVRGNADLTGSSKHSLGELEPKFQLWLKQGFKVVALAATESQLERIRYLLEERSLPCRMEAEPAPHVVSLSVGSLSEGFRWFAEGLVVVTEGELLGTKHLRRERKASRSKESSAAKDWSGLKALSDLGVGDAVVHVDHGIGRYQGIVRLDHSGAPADFLLLEYAGRDKLYLPVYRLNVIQKYVGAGESVALDKLGAVQFAKAKEKVKDAVKRLAVDLVKLYAERKVRPGFVFTPVDAAYSEFEATFPFDETADQLRAIEDLQEDLGSGKVMDRLVCGDVGYGKTEVAIRAAFRAVSDGKQVVVLVPTTVLAHQHEQSFRTRMKDHAVTIDGISRFKTPKEQKAALARLAAGQTDIVVGTHRLLSRDVKFKDLGLIIVDEEHRFGVEHKEKLKAMKTDTHVLTLTATPIPRTLHMALSGLRDISLINTPPVDRLPIRTYVAKFDDALIRQAIDVELNRGGQVFFVHNRVQSIYEIANRIRELAGPRAKVAVGHGQMAEGELEKAMMAFYRKEVNILVSTSIIESGLDVPSANTIIIDRADTFGLAQLYQIRGRVGRGQQRAYAYLLLPEIGITEDAKKRLEVIQRFVELGSGFSIANHDLEIRGGGDLLGPQQSGHIAVVGFDLYTELLEEAIRELQGKAFSPEESSREPEIKAPFPAFLSDSYVPDVQQRLSLYRRFSAARHESEVDRMEEELRDRFGPLPVESQNLLWLIRIKQQLKRLGIDTLTVGAERISLTPGPGSRLDPVRAIALISGSPQKYQLTPDSKFVAKVPTTSLRDLYFSLETLLKELQPRTSAH